MHNLKFMRSISLIEHLTMMMMMMMMMMICHMNISMSGMFLGWHGPWSVWKEYYKAIHRTKLSDCQLHMSVHQVEGLIYICSNVLFGCNRYGKWKWYNKNKPKDSNALPALTNSNRAEAYVEALILSGIANEVMLPDLHTVVTYSDVGYAQGGTKNYIHSTSVNGKQTLLPTISIFTESKASLK